MLSRPLILHPKRKKKPTEISTRALEMLLIRSCRCLNTARTCACPLFLLPFQSPRMRHAAIARSHQQPPVQRATAAATDWRGGRARAVGAHPRQRRRLLGRPATWARASTAASGSHGNAAGAGGRQELVLIGVEDGGEIWRLLRPKLAREEEPRRRQRVAKVGHSCSVACWASSTETAASAWLPVCVGCVG